MSDPRAELAQLVADLRATVGHHARAGAWGASAVVAPRAADAVPAQAQVDDGARLEPDHGPIDADAPPPPRELRSLATIRDELGDCQRCKLAPTRNKIVFGVGAEDAPLMFVGEAPGADEDRLGEPFVGRAGELLDKMIEAMGWTRQSVYIANTLKCRPPGNRTPEADELAACSPFLAAQIGAIRPRVMVALGRPAAQTLLRTTAPISALRGKWHQTPGGVRVMPTFHPAYLLREPARKRDTWADLKLVIAELERLGIASPRPAHG